MYVIYSHMLVIQLKQLLSCLDMCIIVIVCSEVTIIAHKLLYCGITAII